MLTAELRIRTVMWRKLPARYDRTCHGSGHGATPGRCRLAAHVPNSASGRSIFITLHGITAFLTGAFVAGVALLVALVQVAAWLQDRSLVRRMPAALAATAAAFFAGLWLLLAAEFRWVPGEWLDVAAPFLLAGAMWWMYRNRMGAARNRRTGNEDPPPG